MASVKRIVAVDARVVIDSDRFMREAAEHRDNSLIAAYPEKYIGRRTLKNGAGVLLRPIKAEDEGRFKELITSLSVQSMRFRFFEVFKEMPHETLARYCNLDYDRQVAVIAELSSGQIIGAGGVVVEPDGKTGEFAVLVGDEWQGFGLGSLLMDYVMNFARDMRLRKLFGYVLVDNEKMMNLCKKKGFEIDKVDEETAKASLFTS
jgi:acetyltransferase